MTFRLLRSFASYLLLAIVITLNSASVAFALSVSASDVNTGYFLSDMRVDSSGNIHALAHEYIPGVSDQLNIKYLKYNGSSWTTTTLLTGTPGYSYYSRIALDSSGNPGVVWLSWDHGSTSSLYYKKYASGSWGSTVTVATGLSGFSARPALDFYKDGADADYASIITCAGANYYVTQYKADGSGQTPSFGSPISVTNNSTYACQSADQIISSSDVVRVVTGPQPSGSSAYYFSNSGSWSGTGTQILTGIDVQNFGYVHLAQGASGTYYAAMLDDASGSGTDALLFNTLSGGSWGSQETVASGAYLGQEQIDVSADTTNGIPYVFYFDNGNNAAKYAYKSSGSWTSGNMQSGMSLLFDGGYSNAVAADYYSGGTKIFALGGGLLTGPTLDINLYTLTDLPSSGGGGGVPEFRTYVYILTLIAGFGFVYRYFVEVGTVEG